MNEFKHASRLALACALLGVGACGGADAGPSSQSSSTQPININPPPIVPEGCRNPVTAPITEPGGDFSPFECPPDQTKGPNLVDLVADQADEIYDSYLQFVDQCYANSGTTFYAHLKSRFPWAFDQENLWLSDGDDLKVSQTLFEYLLQARRDVYDAWQADPGCPGTRLDQWLGQHHPDTLLYLNYVRSDVASRRPVSDFDGDGKADYATYEGALWYIHASSTGTTRQVSLGGSNQVPVPGDYDNDARTDPAVFNTATGVWTWTSSSKRGQASAQFGISGDLPAASDYDGDGQTDLAVFRPSNNTWYVFTSSGAGVTQLEWGAAGAVPVPGDYDGDGVADYAFYTASNDGWSIIYSAGGITTTTFGNHAGGDRPVPGDYDGDGMTDLAVLNVSSGHWTIRRSSTGQDDGTRYWGTVGDLRTPNDYDGDGATDLGVWRPSTSQWWQWRSTGGQIGPPFGTGTSTPVSSAYMY